jgi:hypothetical protein
MGFGKYWAFVPNIFKALIAIGVLIKINPFAPVSSNE